MIREVTAKIHSIETFGAVDGPGIRTVFFLQGCPARCRYCHNPDTWEADSKTADIITVEDVVKKAKRGKPYYGSSGGVTFSGGEPMLHGSFLISAIEALREEGIGTAVDTSGTYFDKESEEVIRKADLILLDIKHTDPVKFRGLTGRDMNTLYKVMDAANAAGCSVWIRQVVVPGFTDSDEYIKSMVNLARKIDGVEKIELLGYHGMARTKYEKLGIRYPMEGVEDMNPERIKELQRMVDGLL